MQHLRKQLLLAAVAAVAAMAMAVPAAQAQTPAPGYTQFAGCPTLAQNPESQVCLRSVVTSGYLKLGNKKTPITKPLVLTGGLNAELQNFSANSQGGLKPVEQLVPGGVIGITGLDWLVNFLDIDALQLGAITEIAGAPHITFEGLELPIRVRLVNPVLGKNCYIGSFANPIKLNLKEEVAPEFIEHPTSGILTIVKGVFSDKTFSAPGATGCTLTLFGFIPISINGLVNAQAGLPAATGNETVQNMDMELVGSDRVYP